MKKLTLIAIGTILSLSSFSQTTFSVYEKLIIQDGDTITVESDLTDISFKLKGNKIILTLENRKNNI